MAKKKKSRTGLVITLLIIALAVVGSVLYLTVLKKDPPVFVSVEPVGTRTIVQTVNAIGKIQPEFMVKISSEASGEIIFLGVRDGDTVKQGDLLVKIQPDILETQLEQTRAAVESSRMSITIAKAERDRTEADLKRVSELYKKDYATREEMDRAKAAYESAVARYAQSRSDLDRQTGALKQTQATASRTTISAPMNGVVTYLAVEKGEKVVGTATMQGTEIMRIADLSIMNAWVEVDENDVALLSVGDTARIRIDALPERTYRGVVYEISHSPITSAAGTQEEVVNFQVRIRFVDLDPRFRPGMSVSVDIETATKQNVLAVPIQSVTVNKDAAAQPAEEDWRVKEKGQEAAAKRNKPKSIVWVTDGATVQSRGVELGISDQGYIEITSGLKKDERVVTAPYQAVSKLLTNGAKIRVEDPQARKERFDKMRQSQ